MTVTRERLLELALSGLNEEAKAIAAELLAIRKAEPQKAKKGRPRKNAK